MLRWLRESVTPTGAAALIGLALLAWFVLAQTGRLRDDVRSIETRLTAIEADVSQMQEDAARMRDDLAETREDVAWIRETVASMRADAATMRDDRAETRLTLLPGSSIRSP